MTTKAATHGETVQRQGETGLIPKKVAGLFGRGLGGRLGGGGGLGAEGAVGGGGQDGGGRQGSHGERVVAADPARGDGGEEVGGEDAGLQEQAVFELASVAAAPRLPDEQTGEAGDEAGQ